MILVAKENKLFTASTVEDCIQHYFDVYQEFWNSIPLPESALLASRLRSFPVVLVAERDLSEQETARALLFGFKASSAWLPARLSRPSRLNSCFNR